MTDPDLYRSVVDSLSAHVATLDDGGTIVESNRA
jgi:hypothetical protein